MSIQAKLIALLVLVLSLIGVGFVAYECGDTDGRADVQDKWDKANLARSEGNNKAIIKRVDENHAAHEADIAQTGKVLDNYEKRIQTGEQQVHADRVASDAKRMRFAASTATVCPRPAATGEAASAVAADGAGATTIIDIPAAIAKSLRDNAEADDREINRLATKVTGLQDWLISHGFYGPSTDIPPLPVAPLIDGKQEQLRPAE